jgi:hypothetical protein
MIERSERCGVTMAVNPRSFGLLAMKKTCDQRHFCITAQHGLWVKDEDTIHCYSAVSRRDGGVSVGGLWMLALREVVCGSFDISLTLADARFGVPA